jgi:hypothetical protein
MRFVGHHHAEHEGDEHRQYGATKPLVIKVR